MYLQLNNVKSRKKLMLGVYGRTADLTINLNKPLSLTCDRNIHMYVAQPTPNGCLSTFGILVSVRKFDGAVCDYD